MPKVVNHEEYKQEILDKCFELFARDGYKGTGMRDIANELDIATGTMYNYFPKKEMLFEDLFNSIGKKCMTGVYVNLLPLQSRKEKISKIIELFMGNQSQMHKQFLLTIDLIRRYVPVDADRILLKWVRYYSTKLQLHLSLPETATKVLFTFLTGAIYTSNLYGDHETVDLQVEMFENMFLSYINS